MQVEYTLTDEQTKCFHRQGYVTIQSLMAPEEIGKVRVIYDELFATQAGREEGNQYDLAGTDEDDKPAALPQIVSPSKYAPQLEQMSVRSRAHTIAMQLLGADAQLQGEFAIMKPPRTTTPTPWHQDEAFWEADLEYNSLSIWIPLQDVTPENGCLRYIPASHKQEVLPHRPVDNDPRIHGLETTEVDVSKSMDCSVPAGGAVIHHCRTLHGAGGNLSNAPRRAYIFAFATPPQPRSVLRDFPWQKMRKTARDRRRQAAGTTSVSNGRELAKS